MISFIFLFYVIIFCLSCAVRLKYFYISNPPENWRLFMSFSLSKLLICLVPFAFNFSCTEVINSTLRLISLNVRGLSNFKKRRMIYTWCKKKNTDIIFLQETHSTEEVENQWRNEWGAGIIMSNGSSNSRGVAVLVKKGVEVIVHSKIMDPQGSFIILKVEFNDNLYVLTNVYAPNKGKDSVKFLGALRTTLRAENLDIEEKFIVGGDFNCPINPNLGKKGGLLLPRKSVVASVNCFQEDLDLVDIWRVKNPLSRSFTLSQNSPNIFCHLDYWLISNNLQDLVISTSIFPAITVLFNNMRTLKFKAQPTNAFFATVNQMFGGSFQLPAIAERAVIKSLSTVQTTKQCSAIVGSWEEPPNI